MCFTGTVSRWNRSQLRGTDTDGKPNGSLGTLLFEAQQMLSAYKVNWNYLAERLVGQPSGGQVVHCQGWQTVLAVGPFPRC